MSAASFQTIRVPDLITARGTILEFRVRTLQLGGGFAVFAVFGEADTDVVWCGDFASIPGPEALRRVAGRLFG